MNPIKKLYGIISPDEKEDYRRLLALEINSYLGKIYSTMKRHVPLARQKVSPQQIILKHASLGATKLWEFRLNSREEASRGNVGSISVVTRGLFDDSLRKQVALFIAAEFYVYHSFANHPDQRYYKSIMGQNQYVDMLRKILRMKNAHELRDRAMRYIIEEIKEHKLANFRAKGWYISMAKLKHHDTQIAELLGSSERTFNEIVRKQHQRFGPDMMRQEENLVRKEIEDIEHIISLLKAQEKKRHSEHHRKLIKIHIDDLGSFREYLDSIRQDLDRWVVADKAEHVELKDKSFSRAQMKKLLAAEAEAAEIDINKVHILFHHFKKEKINILRDLEILETTGV